MGRYDLVLMLCADTITYICNVDILCLTEHWLCPDALAFLNDIDSMYSSFGVSDKSCFSLNCVAVVRVEKVSCSVQRLNIVTNRIVGITLNFTHYKRLSCLCVCMPSSNATFGEYFECMILLPELFASYAAGSVVCAGNCYVPSALNQRSHSL